MRFRRLHRRAYLRCGGSDQRPAGDHPLVGASSPAFSVPVNKRVVVNGNMVFAAGVTSGIDGALYVAAKLRGEDAANSIQLDMEYAPEPPFNTGTPETAPADILDSTRHLFEASTARREETARRIANRLGVSIPTRT